MNRYIALVHKDKKQGYGVVFPDFMGCVTAGSTLDEALNNAREALAFHIEGMQQDKEAIPAPRTLEEIRAANHDWIDWQDAVAVFVPFIQAARKQERVNVMLDSQLLRAATKRAKASRQSRSAFIQDALISYLEA